MIAVCLITLKLNVGFFGAIFEPYGCIGGVGCFLYLLHLVMVALV